MIKPQSFVLRLKFQMTQILLLLTRYVLYTKLCCPIVACCKTIDSLMRTPSSIHAPSPTLTLGPNCTSKQQNYKVPNKKNDKNLTITIILYGYKT